MSRIWEQHIHSMGITISVSAPDFYGILRVLFVLGAEFSFSIHYDCACTPPYLRLQHVFRLVFVFFFFWRYEGTSIYLYDKIWYFNLHN